MRLTVSALFVIALSASASLGFAQEYVPPQSAQANGGAMGGVAGMEGVLNTVPQFAPSQTGCPVTLTSARLNWPPSYLPVTSAEKVTKPNLALGFKNSSGKAIRSATIAARFLGKEDVYQLDAGAFDLRLTFSGVDAVDKAAEQLREIRVPAKLYAYGVTRVSLEQVLFADGSLWTPFGHGSCSLDVQGSAERVAR